jgi:mannose-6-phosphate isomerase-like protein (cupin superfamily)
VAARAPVVRSGRVSDTVIPLHSRRRDRVLILQKLPNVFGAAALFVDGLLRVRQDPAGYGLALAGSELLTSTLAMGAFGWSVVRAGRPAGAPGAVDQAGIDWVDLLIGAMLGVEAAAQHVETQHWARPTILLAAVMMLTGLLHGPLRALARRRGGLRISNKGLRVGRPFHRFAADWAELKPIAVGDRSAVLETIHGTSHRIDLSDLGNERQVREALREAEVLRTAKRRFAPKSAPASAPLRDLPLGSAASPPPAPVPPMPKPPTLIPHPTIIQAAGNKPKRIEEYAGRVNSGHETVSVARMVSPEGWVEPGQQPDFDEITVVLKGQLLVEYRGGSLEVHAGQAVVTHAGGWIRYSSPEAGGAEYVAICLPAFSPDTVHRDDV